ncbi:MAG: exosome complex RNA-binding protein Csl4 [Thaumarchaeota archaeon]|nr:exosome complex RNA-binding protein Csl4 [Nitrososphaerota archaeon]MDD9809922.1 exosome complex RNA-binding protein Csl4 [Nitrososphaerota archaeon]MDD9814138.1 exosome complex RNA-binding protein Csl4 [Nitrososphaerota archaeon]MDD9826679.1 exosome complex RNA-binding protein Csl4 [Nitrososphaerota archaeon]MDD9842446.1 exosome complex RNA-binding protein Csl4 [Nitrososphaerota archaeon]
MDGQQVFPGDRLASAEEYGVGHGAFGDGDGVRSAVVGTSAVSAEDRTVGASGPPLPVPVAGDLIIGEVAATLASRMAVAIRYVNGRPVTNNVECMLATRNIRMRLIALVGDIVALRITGTLNGDIHATIGEPQLGVLFTKCRKCGDRVMLKRDVVKCVECGWVDERKLSSDYGKADFAGAP